MKLTGKCKQDFWISLDRPTLERFDSLPESCQNALIIEFFDSVGIYISINYDNGFIDCYVGTEWIGTSFINRTHATTEAILKANNLYN